MLAVTVGSIGLAFQAIQVLAHFLAQIRQACQIIPGVADCAARSRAAVPCILKFRLLLPGALRISSGLASTTSEIMPCSMME